MITRTFNSYHFWPSKYIFKKDILIFLEKLSSVRDNTGLEVVPKYYTIWNETIFRIWSSAEVNMKITLWCTTSVMWMNWWRTVKQSLKLAGNIPRLYLYMNLPKLKLYKSANLSTRSSANRVVVCSRNLDFVTIRTAFFCIKRNNLVHVVYLSYPI